MKSQIYLKEKRIYEFDELTIMLLVAVELETAIWVNLYLDKFLEHARRHKKAY